MSNVEKFSIQHTNGDPALAESLKLSRCGLGLYLDGRLTGNTELLLEVVSGGRQ